MNETAQSFSVEIAAPIERCIEVLLDFPRYPDWSSPILEARVVETDDQGRARLVAFALDMRIRTIRYTLEYTYDLPARASWRLSEGDVAAVDGSYEFESLPDGNTRATCTQVIDVGFWIPGPLRRMAERQALRDSVVEFKTEVERLAEAS